MTSLVWIQWTTDGRTSKVHAFVVTDDVRSERSLCHNHPGKSGVEVVADPVAGDRCVTCDDAMRARGKTQQGGRPRRDIYQPQHTFKEWELKP